MKENPEYCKRDYGVSKLPLFQEETNDSSKLGISDLYREINANYLFLADVRFKLLGLAPVVSFVAWAQLAKNLPVNESEANRIAGIIISILGLLITYGIRIYDKRNDELYDDLISRGRRLENDFGIDTGIFRGRRKGMEYDRTFFLCVLINHTNGLKLVYTSLYFGWLVMIGYYVWGILCLLT